MRLQDRGNQPIVVWAVVRIEPFQIASFFQVGFSVVKDHCQELCARLVAFGVMTGKVEGFDVERLFVLPGCFADSAHGCPLTYRRVVSHGGRWSRVKATSPDEDDSLPALR